MPHPGTEKRVACFRIHVLLEASPNARYKTRMESTPRGYHVTHSHTSLCILSIGDFQVKLSTQVAYVPGSRSGVPDASLRLRFYTRPERGSARRISMRETHAHPLGRWLTPVPSTEVKDRNLNLRARGDAQVPLIETTPLYHRRRRWDNRLLKHHARGQSSCP